MDMFSIGAHTAAIMSESRESLPYRNSKADFYNGISVFVQFADTVALSQNGRSFAA